ncbi:hypothetical protein OAK90_00760 [bacterium]|nr:hypothetical protein [bacterium]
MKSIKKETLLSVTEKKDHSNILSRLSKAYDKIPNDNTWKSASKIERRELLLKELKLTTDKVINDVLLERCLLTLRINPEIFFKKQIEYKDKAEEETAYIKALKYYAREHGKNELNYGTMEKVGYIKKPKSLNYYSKKTFTTSDEKNDYPRIKGNSILVKCRNYFGTWDKALGKAGFSNIKRRVVKIPIIDVIKEFDKFDKEHDSKWVQKKLRSGKYRILFKRIQNIFIYKENPPFAHLLIREIYSSLKVAWINLKYYRGHGKLKNDLNWLNKNINELNSEYDENHLQLEKWTLDYFQDKVLDRYANGKSFQRELMIKENSKAKKLSNAAKSRHSRIKGGENESYRNAGVLTAELSRLNRVLNKKPLHLVTDFFRNQVKKSLKEQQNLLSREHCEEKESDFFCAALSWYNLIKHPNKDVPSNDWGKTLDFFGLNSSVWQLSPTKRTRRGVEFQKFTHDIFREYLEEVNSPDSVIGDNQFCHNKILKCDHLIQGCKPDFLFKDKIIDTKTGFHAGARQQLNRYLEHAGSLTILTLNQKKEIKEIEKGKVAILSFSDFLKESKELIGVKIPLSYSKKLTTRLNAVPAYRVDL